MFLSCIYQVFFFKPFVTKEILVLYNLYSLEDLDLWHLLYLFILSSKILVPLYTETEIWAILQGVPQEKDRCL